MTDKEIRESGIIEYYALGLLTKQEEKSVANYIRVNPALKMDYIEIQNSLEALARSVKAPLKRDLIETIIQAIRDLGYHA